MTFKVEKLPDCPAMLTTVFEDFNLNAELSCMNQESLAVLDASSVPLFLITDFRFSIGIDELFSSASTLRKENSIWKHPKIRMLIVITNDLLLRLAAQGMGSPLLGGFNVKLFDNVADALVYIRSQPVPA